MDQEGRSLLQAVAVAVVYAFGPVYWGSSWSIMIHEVVCWGMLSDSYGGYLHAGLDGSGTGM